MTKLGVLTIPQHSVLYRQDRCEDFSFSTCNAIKRHKPLGKSARIACATDNVASNLRQKKNKELRKRYPGVSLARSFCDDE